jgi:predicted TIM-barrel fold metal-dependent hydrolase
VAIELASEVMADHRIDRAVLVQPVFRGEDNSYVADCARAEPTRFAAVCVVDPRTPDADERLIHWARAGCRGLRLRPRIAAEAAVFGDPVMYPLWGAAGRERVVISILGSPEHSQVIGQLAERFPHVPIVIDHMGHPNVGEDATRGSFQELLRLGRHSNVRIKVSGFYHFSRERFPFRDCWPFIRAAYDAFGPARLLWGSDFPHVLVASSYARSITVLDEAGLLRNDAERGLIMGQNTADLYWARSSK